LCFPPRQATSHFFDYRLPGAIALMIGAEPTRRLLEGSIRKHGSAIESRGGLACLVGMALLGRPRPSP
jgi:hypothetical protein